MSLSQALQHLTPAQQRQGHQRKEVAPKRHFTRINMTPAQVLPHLLKLNLTNLKEAPNNPNTSSPYYHSNAKCAESGV